LLESFFEVCYRLAVGFVVSMREVKAGNVHSSIDHFHKHVNLTAGWAEGADNFCSALGDVDGLEDV